MNMLVSGKELPSMKGTFLKPETRIPKEWEQLKNKNDIVLVLTEGPSSAALAFKVWPDLVENVKKIIYAGGTLKRGDCTPFAESSIHKDPEGMESLLNSEILIIFCTMEAAAAHAMTMTDLAVEYAHSPEKYKTISCGVHVETQASSASYGKMICDFNSDNKFGKKNAEIII